MMLLSGIVTASAHLGLNQYKNPITDENCPDPSVLKAPDGMYYMSSGEHIFKSPDLTHWVHASWAFDGAPRPSDNLGIEGDVWASDLNYINGQYVMYFSLSVWGGEWACGICVATSDRPEGPYKWQKKLFTSSEIGVKNSIDPFYIEDNGRKYLFWGSFNGIYGVELSSDGLSVVSGKTQIAGAGWPNGIEGTCIYKRNGYYYLLGSRDTCCEGLNSKYNLVVARSSNLFGPYTNKWGSSAMYNYYEQLVVGDDRVKGPGHCSEVIEDDNGATWLIYHGYQVSDVDAGRVAYLAPITWENDWPVMSLSTPEYGTKPAVWNLAGDVREKYNFSRRRDNIAAKGYDATKITAFCYRDGKLYCVYDFDKIIILDAQTANLVGELPMSDVVAGGTRRLSGIQEYYGSIVASNYATNGQELRLYVWDGDRAQPRLFFSTTDLHGANALGESVNVGGNWDDQWIAFADGSAEPCIVEYHRYGSSVDKARYPLKYEDHTTQHPLGANAKVWMCGGTWWVDGNDCEPTYFGRDGEGRLYKMLHSPWAYAWGAGHTEFWYRNRKYSADVHFNDGWHDGRIRLLIDDSGDYNSISTCGMWPEDGLGANDNRTGIGDVITRTDGNSWVEMWVFSHDQGLAYFTVGNPPETITEPQVTATPGNLDIKCYTGDSGIGVIRFSGRNIDGLPVSLSITGDDCFSLEKESVNPSEGDGEVKVYFSPDGEGTYKAEVEARVDGRLLCRVPVTGTCRKYVADYPINSLTQKWIYSANASTLPQAPWFNSNSISRDMCAANGKVYVLGYNSTVIDILDGETGAHIGRLSTEGISGGLIPLSGIGALGSSIIGINTADADGELRIYRWDSDTSLPRLWFATTNHGDVQVGRTVSTSGTIEDGYISLGFGEAPKNSDIQKAVIYHVSNGNVDNAPIITTLPYTGGNSSNQHISLLPDGSFWLTNKDTYPTHYSPAGGYIEEINEGLTGNKSGIGTDIFTYAGRKYFAITSSLGSSEAAYWGNGVVELLDITDGVDRAVHKGVYPSGGLGTANWGTVGNTAVAHSINDLGNRLNLYVFFPHQGIACFSHEDVYSDVETIVQDPGNAQEVWYTISGIRLNSRPSVAGLYIVRKGDKVRKVAIR